MGVENLTEYGVLGVIVAIVIYFLAKSEIKITYPRKKQTPSTPYEADK